MGCQAGRVVVMPAGSSGAKDVRIGLHLGKQVLVVPKHDHAVACRKEDAPGSLVKMSLVRLIVHRAVKEDEHVRLVEEVSAAPWRLDESLRVVWQTQAVLPEDIKELPFE